MGVIVSSSHVVSAATSSSGGGLLTFFPCSSTRSLSQETVLHKLLQCESFPWAAALHKLPQCGSFPQGAVLQEQAAPAWVPHGITSPATKSAPEWVLLSAGLQVLAGACSSTGSPQGHNFLQALTCSSMGSLPRATGGDLLHHGPPWTAGEQPASPRSSSRAAREESLLWCLEQLLPPSFFTDFGVCRVVSLTSSHSSLPTALSPQCFFPFLSMLSQRRYHSR